MLGQKEIEEGVAGVVDYAMAILEQNPEVLMEAVNKRGPEKAVPQFIATTIKQIMVEDPEMSAEVAIGGALGIFSAIDKMLVEANIKLNPTKKQSLLLKCIEIMIQVNPTLGPKVKELQKESGNPIEADVAEVEAMPDNEEEEVPMGNEQEQGVF